MPDLKPALYIRHTRDLRRLVDRLRSESLLAVDTESNSLYAYFERVCLVQMSTRQEDFIIDPLAVDDMSPLGLLLADPSIEIVFHAAEYDIISLKRDFDFVFTNLFDTMIAARVCGWPAVGLGNLLADHFDVMVDKRHQRADWSTRPLSQELLRYAQMDTHYLPALRDRLLTELNAVHHVEEAFEIFAELPNLAPAQHRFDPEGYWRINGAQDLRRGDVAVLRELYLLRDEIARQRNIPPFKIMGDATLIELTRLGPRRQEDLYGVKGLGPDQARRYGERILQTIAHGRSAPPPRPPQSRRLPDPEVHLRYEALHEWRKQRAAERGVESDVIIPRDTLWALARRDPTTLQELDDIPGLGPWRRTEYGQELLDVLRRASGDFSDTP